MEKRDTKMAVKDRKQHSDTSVRTRDLPHALEGLDQKDRGSRLCVLAFIAQKHGDEFSK